MGREWKILKFTALNSMSSSISPLQDSGVYAKGEAESLLELQVVNDSQKTASISHNWYIYECAEILWQYP